MRSAGKVERRNGGLESGRERIGIPGLAFPDREHLPTAFEEGGFHCRVPLDVALELGLPKRRACFRC